MRSFLYVIALLAVTKLGAQPCNFSIKGHVQDSVYKTNLTNATVVLMPDKKILVTNSKGDFEFSGLCRGNYTLLVSHASCDSVLLAVNVDKNIHVDVYLSHYTGIMQNVNVVASTNKLNNNGMAKIIKGESLQEVKTLSFSEALSNLSGVNMLQTGATIAKPVVHGLHGNRLLIVNNGVRQQGQQWGTEHAPEIDVFGLDEMLVIKGAEELKYGSDAIGGTIIVSPKLLNYAGKTVAEINAGYFTNNQQHTVSAMFEQNPVKFKSFSYRVQGTLKKAANYTTPNYRLNNTAFAEADLSVSAGWKKTNKEAQFFYSLFSNKAGVFSGSHLGNLTDLLNAIKETRPADVFLNEKTYSIARPYQQTSHHLARFKANVNKGTNKFYIQLATQLNNRTEFDVTRSASAKGPQMQLQLLSINEDMGWDYAIDNHFKGTLGIAAMQQNNVVSGTYLIPNFNLQSYGVFFIKKIDFQRWEFHAGLRSDYKHLSTTRYPYNSEPVKHQFNFLTVGAAGNILYKIPGWGKINLGTTYATRSPHVDELLSSGVHHGIAAYEEGNIYLKPERSLYTTLNAVIQRNRVAVDINLYNNHVNNFIYRQPMPDEPVLTVRGAFPKFVYNQTNATLYGADVDIDVQVLKKLSSFSKLSIVRGWNTVADEWMLNMPADRFTQRISYQFGDKRKFTKNTLAAEVVYVAQQKRIPVSLTDYKVPPDAFTLINMQAGTTILVKNNPVILMLICKNVLNTSYREYLNSFRYFADEIGRNVQVTVRVPLQFSLKK